MPERIVQIAWSTLREAVRDRVLYNLLVFALLLVGCAPLLGQISIGIERIFLVQLGLAAITLFGVLIAVFIGIQLVVREIDKKTLYTLLARPVRRWEFIVGKFLGLAATLAVNTACMVGGLFLAVLYVERHASAGDLLLVPAAWCIMLQFLLVTALALLFSTFSTPIFSAVFAFSLFALGSLAGDLRAFASMAQGGVRWLVLAVAYAVPNIDSLNLAARVAHNQPIPASLVAWNTAYVFAYVTVALAGAVLAFERRDLK